MRLFAGQSAWVVQRLSAVVLLVLLVAALASVALRPAGYAAWRETVSTAHGAVPIVVGFAAIALHGWIGVRDVVLDYVHRPSLRLAVLAIVVTLLLGVLARVALTLARVSGMA